MMVKAKRIVLRLRDRSTGDLLVLLIALTITMVLLVVTVSTITYAFVFPESRPLDQPAQLISDMMNTLIGLLAGFMVGRTRTVVRTDTASLDAGSDNEATYVSTTDDDDTPLDVVGDAPTNKEPPV